MPFATRTAKRARRALGAALFVAAIHTAHADTAFHWGYSAMFGSGTYLIGSDEVDVYRASFKAFVRDAPEAPGGRPGVAVLLPVAIGLNDTDAVVPETDDDEELRLATFLPGIALDFKPRERLLVRTNVQLGAGRELNAADGRRDSVRLAAVGVRTHLLFESLPGQPALINGLLWAGFDAKQRVGSGSADGAGGSVGGIAIGLDETVVDAERGSLFRLTAGFEFHVPTPRWQFRERPMYLQPHVLAERYYRPPSGLSLGDADAPPPLKREWQIGVAAGRESGFKLLFFKFDSVGIAYRFSGHNDGLRFYLNSVF